MAHKSKGNIAWCLVQNIIDLNGTKFNIPGTQHKIKYGLPPETRLKYVDGQVSGTNLI